MSHAVHTINATERACSRSWQLIVRTIRRSRTHEMKREGAESREGMAGEAEGEAVRQPRRELARARGS